MFIGFPFSHAAKDAELPAGPGAAAPPSPALAAAWNSWNSWNWRRAPDDLASMEATGCVYTYYKHIYIIFTHIIQII